MIALLPVWPGHLLAQGTATAYDNPESFRPKIHFSPRQDWMSDPNGLVHYAGEYHLFYQHVIKGRFTRPALGPCG